MNLCVYYILNRELLIRVSVYYRCAERNTSKKKLFPFRNKDYTVHGDRMPLAECIDMSAAKRRTVKHPDGTIAYTHLAVVLGFLHIIQSMNGAGEWTVCTALVTQRRSEQDGLCSWIAPNEHTSLHTPVSANDWERIRDVLYTLFNKPADPTHPPAVYVHCATPPLSPQLTHVHAYFACIIGVTGLTTLTSL